MRCRIIKAPQKYLHFYQTPQHDGGHILNMKAMNIVCLHRRGQRFSEKRTKNPEEILFWFLSDLLL